MRFRLTRDPEEFARHAEDFVAARPERNVLATLLVQARAGSFVAEEPLFGYAIDADGTVAAAVLRIPPRPLLASELDGDGAERLLDAWLPVDPTVPGVSAPGTTARVIAEAWSCRTGGPTECRMREAIHELSAVRDPPRPAPGALRRADAGDRELLVEWEREFALEAGMNWGDRPERAVDVRLARGGQFVWVDGGRPVSTLGRSPAVAGVARIGPVYTPPAKRRRGYAASAVATACRGALAAGARRCMLFTDLANPTSNRVYASIGFRRFAGWEEWGFE